MRSARPGYEACSGCSLCLLACPIWRATRDIRLTPHGRAKALQHGALAGELEDSVDACTLCGACEPACPEDIGLVAMVTGLRAELAFGAPRRIAAVREQMAARTQGAAPAAPAAACMLIPGRSLAADSGLLGRVARLLHATEGAAVAEDDGADIARALEAGAGIPDVRLARFLAPLRRAKRLVVGDGMLMRALRDWLPGVAIESLGAALSATAGVRESLRPTDLYVIEPGAYHTDQERLVKYYDAMRVSIGLAMNLDLQRLAIPTTAGSSQAGRAVVDPLAQARWILEGNECSRVVVEDPQDIAVFSAVTDRQVLHLAQLV